MNRDLLSHRKSFIADRKTGPLLRLTDLSVQERSLVEKDVARRVTSGERISSSLYLDTLHSWGIMCPHPVSSRSYGGVVSSDVPVSFAEYPWYDCDTCGCIVINR